MCAIPPYKQQGMTVIVVGAGMMNAQALASKMTETSVVLITQTDDKAEWRNPTEYVISAREVDILCSTSDDLLEHIKGHHVDNPLDRLAETMCDDIVYPKRIWTGRYVLY